MNTYYNNMINFKYEIKEKHIKWCEIEVKLN